MKLNSVATPEADLKEILKECKKRPVVIMQKGRSVAVLVGVKNEDEVDHLIYTHCRELHESLERSRQQIAEGKVIPHDEFWKMLEAEYAEEDAKQARKKPAAPRAKAPPP